MDNVSNVIIEEIEWHRISYRDMTEEEWLSFVRENDYVEMDDCFAIVGETPADDSEVLVDYNNGVGIDVYTEEYGFEKYCDREEVVAWAYFPKGVS